MTVLSFGILFVASLTAGVINTIAGGGSFLTFPSLLLTGLDPRAANITSTVFLFPMQLTSGFAGRKLAVGTPLLSLRALVIISAIGGAIGALLLMLTPPATFGRLVPWLILFATLIFAYSSFVKKPTEMERARALGLRGTILAQMLISIYGGYFGGGIGFLMLAALTLSGMSIRKAGATKNILAGVMNASAVSLFVFMPDVGWLQACVGAIGAICGGLIGVRILKYVNEKLLRMGVVVIGLCLTVAMFLFPG